VERKPNKQEERSARTRAALIAAARPLFAERGFAAVGTEEVVRAAGVTRGSLYHQFTDKTELFAAVFEELEIEVTGQLAAVAMAGAADPLAALGAAAREMLRIFAEPGPERIALIDAPSVLGWERVREIAERHGLGLVIAALEAAVQGGTMAPVPVRPLAHLLIGALDEGVLYVARAADQHAARQEVAATFDRLLDGLRGCRPR
jgi:AcrR family transcriptional regulator